MLTFLVKIIDHNLIDDCDDGAGDDPTAYEIDRQLQSATTKWQELRGEFSVN